MRPPMERCKARIGSRLRAYVFVAEQTEIAIGTADVNRMPMAAHPQYVRFQQAIA